MDLPVLTKLRYPLHVHIGVLFIALIATVGVILAGFSYQHINNLIADSTDDLFGEIAEDIETVLRHEYSPIIKSVELLGYAGISKASQYEERMAQLPMLAQAMVNQPHTTSLNIGYSNGDYLAFRPADRGSARSTFAAPDAAYYVVDHLAHNAAGGGHQVRLFLDQQLSVIESRDLGHSDFDPRERPWFISTQSTKRTTLTEPYLFYFIKELGITISRQSTLHNTVIAADVTLKGLSETLAERKVSPSAVSILYDGADKIYAYNDGSGQSLFVAGAEAKTPTTAHLNSSIIEKLSNAKSVPGDSIPFIRNGINWLGDIRPVTVGENLKLNLLVAAPEKELFSTALSFRRTSMMITLAVVLLALPITWVLANQIARPLRRLSEEARAIADFDFSQPSNTDSVVLEIHHLGGSMNVMRSAIENFLNLITSLSGESDVNRLLERVTQETMAASEADGALIYLLSDSEDELHAHSANFAVGGDFDISLLPPLSLGDDGELMSRYHNQHAGVISLQRSQARSRALLPLFDRLELDVLNLLALPLQNRRGEATGVLCLIYTDTDDIISDAAISQHRLGFTRALSGFAAVSMESRQLIHMQKALLQSFIELIASAIDAKSPYTGGHCQRVPELVKMLANAACNSQDERFADFDLSEEEWEELRIAAWLHDCGKVTTPEYVVDKSTKLETNYDRIHEIRTRFEVLKRDAEIAYWQALADGAQEPQQEEILQQTLQQLDDDYQFVAECNVGGEYMSDDSVARLQSIAAKTWRRTLDDRIGISWEEGQRKAQSAAENLPVDEPLIADKVEHIFPRPAKDRITDDNPHGFSMEVPEYKYNRGELYNLSVRKGTLTEEERFKINEHMVQTITMLNQLPYPRHLRNVPEIAGGHHETMDGKGYPKRLRKEDMSLTARMMAIADIFEALTAADRPYKKAKTLSESVRIMHAMKRDQHIDPDLFDLFLSSGVYREYGEALLDPEQLDDVDIEQYLDTA
jgi:HD-GYP domain-containing protein (c-di-GMP phosphodiesterase class II)/HAMP domain-containing protein